jgi:hypothetical protein
MDAGAGHQLVHTGPGQLPVAAATRRRLVHDRPSAKSGQPHWRTATSWSATNEHCRGAAEPKGLGLLGSADPAVHHGHFRQADPSQRFPHPGVGRPPVRAAVEVEQGHVHLGRHVFSAARPSPPTARCRQMNTAGVAASPRTCRPVQAPPQQPQRYRPGTAAKAAGIANMPLMIGPVPARRRPPPLGVPQQQHQRGLVTRTCSKFRLTLTQRQPFTLSSWPIRVTVPAPRGSKNL